MNFVNQFVLMSVNRAHSSATVKQALVPASLLTSVLDGSLLGVDVGPLVIHCLHGLQAAGVVRAVVVLGVGAEKLVHTVQREHFHTLRVEFIWGVEANWGTSLANNIMAARSGTAWQCSNP